MLTRKNKASEDGSAPKGIGNAGLSKKLVQKASSARRKPSNKGASFVAFIGDEGAVLIYTRGNKVLRRLFAPSSIPEHMQTIIELLQKNPNVPLYIMLDTIDQQYVRQTFPPVSALSVSKLVSRRLKRDFPAGDITGAIALGREEDGRKEWAYLLISLANNESLQAWLDIFLEMPNECKGLFLTPVEGQRYAQDVISQAIPSSNHSWQLLVSHNKVGGIRQIVLRGGRLTFTRLTQSVDENNPALTAGNIEQEIQNTIDYLRRFNFDDNAKMVITVIAAQEINEHIDLDRFGVGANAKLTPYDVGTLLNIEQAALSGDRFGDAVMGAAFATASKKQLPLYTSYAKKLSMVYKGRLFGKALAACIIAYALYSSATATLDWLNASQERNAIAQDLQAKRAQLSQSEESIASFDKDTALWTSVVAVYDAYRPNEFLPFRFIESLAEQLNSDTRVTKMNWQAPLSAQDDGRSPPTGRQQEEPPKGATAIVTEVEFVGDYLTQDEYIEAANQFFAQLQSGMPEYHVSSDNLPGREDPTEEKVISLEDDAPEPFQKGKNKVNFTFNGPFEVKADEAAS